VDEAGGIAGPGRHVVAEGGGDVDPGHGEWRVESGRGSLDRIYKINGIDGIF
jgi:hypothetical protein